MQEVHPSVALGIRIEIIRVVVCHMILRRERHDNRFCISSYAEIDDTVVECYNIKGRSQNVETLYDLHETVVPYIRLECNRSNVQIRKQHLVSLFKNNVWNRFVYPSVEHIIMTVLLVVLYRSIPCKTPDGPAEIYLETIVFL